MRHYMSYILTIKKIDNFSLSKEKKNKIFGFIKTIRYKYENKNTKYNSLNYTIPKNDLIICKVINLNFIKTVHIPKKVNENETISDMNKKAKSLKNSQFKKELNNNHIKYCKKAVNNSLFNKNVLIKPIMYEDYSFCNKNIIKKTEQSPKINLFQQKSFINGNSYFNNLNYSLHNNFTFNNFFKKENYFTNINNNLKQGLENKLKAPNLFSKGFDNLSQYNFKANNSEIRNSNRLIINNYILTNEYKDDKGFPGNENNQLFEKSSTPQKFLTNSNNIEKSKQTLKFINKQKGRKSKNSQYLNNESKHTKHSSDNMMRKIKNKVIESSRLLVNKVLKEEIKNNPNQKFKIFNREFRKIKGSFGQELNIKYNCWFYQIKIKDIFSMEISNKYTTIEKSSNNELINYLFSPINNNMYNKTKELLNTPFHQYYHDIFLNENKNWKIYYGINEKDDKYQIEHLIKNLQEEGEANEENIKYINDINKLAHNYENFFLEKKPRNVDFNNKKNNFIKELTNNSLNDKYLQLCEEVKQLKNFYENRNLLKNKLLPMTLVNEKNVKNIDILLMKNNNYKNITDDQFIKKLNNSNKLDGFIENNDKTSKFECYINNNISLEEPNKENYNEDISRIVDNKKKAIFYNSKEKELKNIYKEQNYCNKKRKNAKIKYFISCKKKRLMGK